VDNTKQGWGQGTQVDSDKRPVCCTQFQNKYGKYSAVFIEDNTKKIYLTFDEGYENGYTSKILDSLKEKKVPAVFFVTYDYAKRNHDLVQRMIREGHIVGNHSYTHPSMPTLSISKASDEITKMHSYVKENFNYTMTLFRPPMGEFSERTLALAQNLKYKSVFWSFAYVDWNPQKQIGTDKAYKKVVSGLHNGAIYLLHAVSKDNAEILGAFIDKAKEEGYEFARLS
jgi:peptidoglycan-N-acetylmuramic acid deacetylase